MSGDGLDVILSRMMALHPKIIDLTLDRVHRLLAALGAPEAALPPVIHVAGTNGKGSTQAMIRAGLGLDLIWVALIVAYVGLIAFAPG